MADCFLEVKNAIRKISDETVISDSEIKDLVDDLEALKSQTQNNREKSGSFQELVRQKLEAQREISIKEQMIKAGNIIKTQRFISAINDPAIKGSAADKFLAELEGGTATRGTRFGTIQEAQALSRQTLGNLEIGLKREGLFDVLKDRSIEKDTMKAIYDLENGKVPDGSKLGTKAAKYFIGASNTIRQAYKDAGVPIGKIPGWIMRQGHDAEKISKDLPGWISDQLKHLDHEKTFKPGTSPAKKVEILNEAAQKIISGRWSPFDDEAKGVADQLITINKLRVTGKDARSARVFHYKDGENFYEYNSKWGKDSLLDSTYRTIDKESRNVALLRKFGTNPEAAMEANIKRVEQSLKDSPKELDKFRGSQNSIRMAFKIAQGTSDHVGHDMVAKGFASFRALQAMSKLSLTAVRATNDVNSAMALIKSATGKNAFEVYSRIIPDYLEQVSNLSGLKKQDVAKKTGIFMTDFMHEMFSRASGEIQPNLDGKFMTGVNNAQDIFFKYTGIKAQEQTGRATVAKAISNLFADEVGNDFSKLHPNMQNTLKRFDISEPEWNVLRNATEEFYDGTKGITTNAIDNVDKEVLADVLGMRNRKVTESQLKSNLKNKLAALYQGYGDMTVLATQPSTQRFTKQVGGGIALVQEMAKMAMQFKGAALTQFDALSTISSPAGKYSKSSILNNTVPYLVAGTVTAFGIEQFMNLAKGKPLDDPRDPASWTKAFGKSGAFGLYGSLVENAGEFGGFLEGVAGPGISSIVNTIDKTAKPLKEGKVGKAAAGFINEQAKNLPLANLKRHNQNIYDVLILNHMNEFLNPGFGARREARLRKQMNR